MPPKALDISELRRRALMEDAMPADMPMTIANAASTPSIVLLDDFLMR
jgi:hypothetical protein